MKEYISKIKVWQKLFPKHKKKYLVLPLFLGIYLGPFLNFFILWTLLSDQYLKKDAKNVRKSAKNAPPLTPLTPQNPLFWWEGLRHYLPRVENNITLLFLLNLVSYPYHNKGPKMAPPRPPSAPKPIFLMGKVKKLLTHAKKTHNFVFGCLLYPLSKKRQTCAK